MCCPPQCISELAPRPYTYTCNLIIDSSNCTTRPVSIKFGRNYPLWVRIKNLQMPDHWIYTANCQIEVELQHNIAHFQNVIDLVSDTGPWVSVSWFWQTHNFYIVIKCISNVSHLTVLNWLHRCIDSLNFLGDQPVDFIEHLDFWLLVDILNSNNQAAKILQS